MHETNIVICDHLYEYNVCENEIWTKNIRIVLIWEDIARQYISVDAMIFTCRRTLNKTHEFFKVHGEIRIVFG